MAHQKWTVKQEDRKWNKAWYEPFDQIDKVSLGLRFTSGLPVHAMIPPGHWELFKMAVELAQAGALTPLNDAGRQMVVAIAKNSERHRPKTGQIRVFQLDTWQAFARFLLIRRGGGPAEWE
jgi:hypothetical protein